MPRVGAIAISSLAGVVLGVRGGFFRKLFYASITGSSMAAVCYPREAKKYATVAYNFAYGKVSSLNFDLFEITMMIYLFFQTPNEANQKDLPKFPSSFDQVKDQVVGLSQKAYDAVFKK